MIKVEQFLSSRSVVFMRGKAVVYESTDRGIKPLVAAVDSGIDYSGCDAADRIVGKAAALLLVKGAVARVCAEVMSVPAKDVLSRYGIPFEYGSLVDNIVNRAGTDMCPMEQAVLDVDNPDDAPAALVRQIEKMKKNFPQ